VRFLTYICVALRVELGGKLCSKHTVIFHFNLFIAITARAIAAPAGGCFASVRINCLNLRAFRLLCLVSQWQGLHLAAHQSHTTLLHQIRHLFGVVIKPDLHNALLPFPNQKPL